MAYFSGLTCLSMLTGETSSDSHQVVHFCGVCLWSLAAPGLESQGNDLCHASSLCGMSDAAELCSLSPCTSCCGAKGPDSAIEGDSPFCTLQGVRVIQRGQSAQAECGGGFGGQPCCGAHG